MTDDFDELLLCGFHPVFSVEDGSCLMEPGCAYEIWFRNPPDPRHFSIANSSGKKEVYQSSILTFLYYEKQVQVDWAGELTKYKFHFFYDNAIVYFGTTNRTLDYESVRTYMIWFRKVI